MTDGCSVQIKLELGNNLEVYREVIIRLDIGSDLFDQKR